jgi:hypothetical protein
VAEAEEVAAPLAEHASVVRPSEDAVSAEQPSAAVAVSAEEAPALVRV